MGIAFNTDDDFDLGAIIDLSADYGIDQKELNLDKPIYSFSFVVDMNLLESGMVAHPNSIFLQTGNDRDSVIESMLKYEFSSLYTAYEDYRYEYQADRLEAEGEAVLDYYNDYKKYERLGISLEESEPYKAFLEEFPAELPSQPDITISDNGKVTISNLPPQVAQGMELRYEQLVEEETHKIFAEMQPTIPIQEFATAPGVLLTPNQFEAAFYMKESEIRNFLNNYEFKAEQDPLPYLSTNPSIIPDYNNTRYLSQALSDSLNLPEGYTVNIYTYEDSYFGKTYRFQIESENNPGIALRRGVSDGGSVSNYYDPIIDNLGAVLAGDYLQFPGDAQYYRVPLDAPTVNATVLTSHTEGSIKPRTVFELTDAQKAMIPAVSELLDSADLNAANNKALIDEKIKNNPIIKQIVGDNKLADEDLDKILTLSIENELKLHMSEGVDVSRHIEVQVDAVNSNTRYSIGLDAKPHSDYEYMDRSWLVDLMVNQEEVGSLSPLSVPQNGTQQGGVSTKTPNGSSSRNTHPGGGGP